MRKLAIAVALCPMVAGGALAGQMNGHGHQGPGWGSGLNVYVDVPMTTPTADARGEFENRRCREVRHICFGRFGVNEPQYGDCVWRRHC